MKKIKILFLFVTSSLFLNSCFEDLDDTIQPASTVDIQDFIYKAMNIWYLYKPEVPDLSNDRFATQGELNDFLTSFSSPEALFDALTAPQDEFSFIVDNYLELESALAGISLNHGMEYGLVPYPGSQTDVLGYVHYIIPNSDASVKGLERGMIFNTINGAQLTRDNYNLLQELESYEIGFATYDGTNVTPTGETVTLVKSEITENPIHVARTHTVEGEKVGYLMYNGFTANFDAELNNVFATFQAEGISDLILDLRYNGGGSVETAVDLSSMVTGQFNNEIFATQVWNPELQAVFEQNNPEDLIDRFNTTIRTGEAINSLNLNRLYVITSSRTASASELVINGLDPYIEVIQVGGTTTGKFQASTTFYDGPAPNFNRNDANPGHLYAIQPLIYTSANANGETGFIDGLPPDVEIFEDLTNLGVLGEVTEPLLEAALDDLFGRSMQNYNTIPYKEAGNSKMHLLNYERMYVDEIDKNPVLK